MSVSRHSAVSVTGFSLSMIGLQWSPPEPERKIVRELLIFLADRRVLFNDFTLEVESQVIHSLNDIRCELTSALQRLADDAPATPPVNQMRGACRRFLDHRWPEFHVMHPMAHDAMGPNFFLALGELRATFGRSIAELSVLGDTRSWREPGLSGIGRDTAGCLGSVLAWCAAQGFRVRPQNRLVGHLILEG
ncbi:protein of unknown function [Magnetospirillum sp. XM-1]|uniref:DUF6650 family protein n=1 Tax=Magnetospirillum sp. XM-1 TaxID=1663591 RepID=UPI00073DF713|nr:protein of unknown function [Magnetospirillum sp. XM-1]